MPELKNNIISFRDTSLKEKLLTRGESANAIAGRELNRYYALLSSALSDVDLNFNEAKLLCDLFNGVLFGNFEFSPKDNVLLEVMDAQKYLFEKWEVDRSALLTKLKSFSIIEAVAVIDAVERFWHYEDRDKTLDEIITEVGLVRQQQKLSKDLLNQRELKS